MSGKYVFSKGLKELRFLFCQSSEQSAATRHVPIHPPISSALPAHRLPAGVSGSN
ncbi:hypothetical protein PENSUB_761 [Penicillium subrubescens]|uniref:Uncharacterized protein n=1 Tax=Penicillium subrubescens TaxID=1316194 RepID=A0A1Q5UM84_9EURO|nr:hypothetical protein PENSUB_761 [Penicillium subrubescens]